MMTYIEMGRGVPSFLFPFSIFPFLGKGVVVCSMQRNNTQCKLEAVGFSSCLGDNCFLVVGELLGLNDYFALQYVH